MTKWPILGLLATDVTGEAISVAASDSIVAQGAQKKKEIRRNQDM